SAGATARRLPAGEDRRGPRRFFRTCDAERRRAGFRRSVGGQRAAIVMGSHPTIAITSGEPAGIGPELVARLAERHRAKPFPARLVVLGDERLLAARAHRIGVVAPRYVRYDPLAFSPVGHAIEVWHQPLAAPAV